jgi:hypothetical protein
VIRYELRRPTILTKKFTDLASSDLTKLPNLTQYHFCVGVEWIYLHLFNEKNMHWYLAEYGPIGKRFFGFFEDRSNGISSGFLSVEDLMKWSKKGGPWEPMVDESWKPTEAKEIVSLQGYIKMIACPPDTL